MPSPLQAAMCSSALSSPRALPGMSLWLDASSPASLPGASVTNDPVASWLDQSTSALTLSQGTGTNQPTLQLASQNGRAGILFDGVNDTLSLASGINALKVAAKTLFLVLKPAVAAPGGTKVTFTLNANNYYLAQASSGGLTADWANGAGTQKQASGGTSTSYGTSTAHVVTNRYLIDGSGNPTVEIWLDGIRVLSSVQTDGYSSTYGTTLVLGGASASAFWNGTIYEVIFCATTLSDTARQAAERYLKTKWGTP